jgi:hypothetical protein
MDIEQYGAKVIRLEEIAARFGVERSVARKWLDKEGFSKRFARFPATRNQKTFVLNRDDYHKAIQLRKERGFEVK